MDSKMIAGVVVGALVIGGGSFYGGMQYSNQSRASLRGQFAAQGAGRGGVAGAGGRFGGAGGGFVAGTILSKDATSITLQLGGPNASSTNNGATGSKIVLVNGSTEIGKFTTGTAGDLSVGDQVTVQGSANSDGSVTAQMIQIRPAGMGRGQ
jgi:hypothetical protein